MTEILTGLEMNMAPLPEKMQTLMAAAAAGDESASEQLFPIVYEHLHCVAESYMRQERANHTLQPTALIHEAYLRLVKKPRDGSGQAEQKFASLEHFLATAAQVMRRVLVNHAKAKKAQKRNGRHSAVQIEEVVQSFDSRSVDLIALDEAMERLSQIDPVQHRIVELRFFGGLSVEQAAELLQISPRTAYYEWSYARAWLRAQLEQE